MSNRQLNERIPPVGGTDGSSPYKRPRDQSPGAVQAPVPPQAQRGASYTTYPTDAASRYAAGLPTSYAMYTREPYQAERGDYSRDMEISTRRRPMLLRDFPSHPAALERERHAQEQHYHYNYADRDPVTTSQFMNRPTTIAPPQHPPHQQAPPKRPKLAVEPRPELTQPLRIETGTIDIKREPAYTPQVEAISPTLPTEDAKAEITSVQSSKEELLNSINRIDLEIGKVEIQITKLKKKQGDFEAEAAKPPEVKSLVADTIPSEPKNQSVAQIIYAENRKKADAAHSSFKKLGQKIDLPLYNQPSDTPVYHENKRNYHTFKKKLLVHFKKKHHSRMLRERYLTNRYDQLMQGWLKRLERSENNAKKRAKDARTREFFEKVFPELKKQREDKERIQRAEANTTHHSRVGANNRVGGYARSEAELEQIMDGLHEQEEEEKKMRSYAVIPPMLLDARERQQCFNNNNGLIEDPMAEYKERQVFNVWNQTEKDLFKERFLQHPKNFGYIASFLERKSVQDCVQYYYLSKKNENYKQLLRKQSVKKRKFPKHVKPIRPGVSEDKDDKPESQEQVPIIATTPDRKPEDRERLRLAIDSVVTTSTSVPTATAAVTTIAPLHETKPAVTTFTCTTSTASPTTSPVPVEIKPEVKSEVKHEPMDEADTKEQGGDQGAGTHTCAVCKSELEHYARSRPLTKSNCENYGIKEEDLTTDMRVCSSCRCRSVRKRYTHCPVPMCKTPKKKVKRLRPLPSKWAELSTEIKEPIIKELQLNDEITKCCSACFNRMARRLGNNPQTNEPLVPLVSEHSDELVETPRWTEEEMEIAKQGLREHGRDWAAISSTVGTKSEAQCKNFYFNYKRKFSLEQLVEEHRRTKAARDGNDGRTVSISESVASTITAPSEEDLSSSDEDNGEDNDESSDTASAPSPPPVQRTDMRHDSSTADAMEIDEEKKEEKVVVEDQKPPDGLSTTNPNLSASQGSLRSIPDYDSSATLSADEGPPSSSHHEASEKKMDVVPHSVTSTASSETFISSSGGRTHVNTSPQMNPSRPISSSVKDIIQDRPASQPNVPVPSSVERPYEPEPENKVVTTLMEKRSPPACVRDLIDCAIERNIVQDLTTQKMDMVSALHLSSHPNHDPRSSVGVPQPNQAAPPRMAFPKEPMKELPREALESAVDPGPRTGSPFAHQVYAPRDERDVGAQDLSRRAMTQPGRNRSPQTAYKGNPRDYDPMDPRYHEIYRRPTQGHEPQPMGPLRAPPPAHSHHGVGQRLTPQSEGLHQLASAASDREPPRPHSEGGSAKPSSSYHSERSQMTPPSLRQSASPFAMERMAQHVPSRGGQPMNRQTIGQPPPLINIKQGPVGKVPMKSEKMSPIPQPPSGGSITQGTPVQQPPSSQPQTTRYEGSISLGTPRYDPGLRSGSHSGGGSISMGTPRYDAGGGRATPEGPVPRMPGVYDAGRAGAISMTDPGMRIMYESMYRRMSPSGQPGFYPQPVPYPSPQGNPQYPTEQLSSSRAVLMGDFLTAQQMQHAQDAQRRADKDRQLSPRSRDQVTREGLQGKNFPHGMMETGMPPPFSPMYVHPSQVPVSSSQDRVGGRTSSPMPSRTGTPPRTDSSGPHWSQGHPAGRPQPPSQVSPGGQGPPSDHRHPTPPPRQNVIRSITHGTAGAMMMDRMSSSHPQQQNSHLGNNSRLATLVEVATNAPSLAVPAKDRHQLSPGPHQSKERAHVLAMEQEREWQEREKERRDVQQREAQVREAQQREAQAREAHARDAQAREAQAREAHAREAQAQQRMRELERDRYLMAQQQQQQQQEHHRNTLWYKMGQERKEMETRQVNAERERERERHEREKERERHDLMVNENRPASRESYPPHHAHPRAPSSGGTLRTMERPPDGRPPANHMEAGVPPGYAYSPYMPHGGPYQGPPRSEAAPMGISHRPPSRDTKPHEGQERRIEYQKNALKKEVPPAKPAPGSREGGGGGGAAGSSAAQTFTAATLIDAIIIHQINNGSNSEEDKVAGNCKDPQLGDPGQKYLLPGASPTATHKVHRAQPSPHDMPMVGPHGSMPPSQAHPSLAYPHQARQSSPKTDPSKDQRSPPYKPHKTIAKSLDSREAAGLVESQQQQLQHEQTSSSSAPHLGVSSSADVERSQDGMSAADKAASIRAITLGEHIDAIIIQDYTQKGKGPSPNGMPITTEPSSMSPAELSTSNAIKSFLAHTESGMDPNQARHPTSSPSQVASSSHVTPDSSQRVMDSSGRPRSMSIGAGQHKPGMVYQPGTIQQGPNMVGMLPDQMASVRGGDMSRVGSSQEMVASQHSHNQNGPHRHASPSPQTHGPPPPSQSHSQGQQHPHGATSQSPLPMRPAIPSSLPVENDGGEGRPRSFSAGAHKVTPGWNNWKLRRALEQHNRDQHVNTQVSTQMPQKASAQSPVALAPDEREIVKVARVEAHHSPADQRVTQSGQGESRSPQAPGYNMEPISPASSSTDSGGPEPSMKPSPPRSPRMHQVSAPGVSQGMMGHAAMTSGHPPSSQMQQPMKQVAPPGSTSGHQPISSLAASHQAITSLLSRPQNKQTSFPADSSVMSQRGEQLSTSHRQHKSPLAYVQDKIAEVIQNPESGSRPSSSTSSSSDNANWEKRTMLHPLDAGRYSQQQPRGGPVESSTHRDWSGERYAGGLSPMRDDNVTGSKQKSPRPSVHSQSSEESQGSTVSSADDIYSATSSTMKPHMVGQSGREYCDRLVQSPMVVEGMSRSPRPSYADNRLPVGMVDSSNRARSPKFSPVGTSDMAVPGSSDDPRPNPSVNPEAHSSDSRMHRPHSHAQPVRETSAADDLHMSMDQSAANASSHNITDSPQPDRMAIDEVGGADSSAHLDKGPHGSDGCQSISTSQHPPSITSSKLEYMKADTQLVHPGGGGAGGGGGGGGGGENSSQRSHHSVNVSSHGNNPDPGSSSSASISSVSSASSSALPHVESSRYSNSPFPVTGDVPPSPHPQSSSGHPVHTPSEAGVSTSSSAGAYERHHYLYPPSRLTTQHPHNGATVVPHVSPSHSPSPIVNREAEPSPLLSSQYETLSDDES